MSDTTKTADKTDTSNVGDIPGIAASQELAIIEAQRAGKIGSWALWMLGRGELPTMDPDLIRDKILLSMLTAESEIDLFNAGKAWSLDDLQGVPLKATQVTPMKSSFPADGGPGVFMVIDCVNLKTGEQIVVATSAGNVMAALCRAQDMGWEEFTFKVKKAERATTDGFYPFQIEQVLPHEIG